MEGCIEVELEAIGVVEVEAIVIEAGVVVTEEDAAGSCEFFLPYKDTIRK